MDRCSALAMDGRATVSLQKRVAVALSAESALACGDGGALGAGAGPLDAPAEQAALERSSPARLLPDQLSACPIMMRWPSIVRSPNSRMCQGSSRSGLTTSVPLPATRA